MAAGGTGDGIEWRWPTTNLDCYGAEFEPADGKCKITFDVPEFKKKKMKDSVQPGGDELSFSFVITDASGAKVIECEVTHLPGKVKGTPKIEIKDKFIIAKIQQVEKGSWAGKLANKRTK